MDRPFAAALLVALVPALGACSDAVVDDGGPATDDIVPGKSGNVPRSAQATSRTRVPIEDPDTAGTTPSQPANVGPLFRAAYDGTPATNLNTFYRDEAALQADGTLTIATKKGRLGADPQPTGYLGGSFYNGGTFRYATVVSPVWNAAKTFDRVTTSFEAITPPGTWLEVHVSAHLVATGAWTKDFDLGVWAYDDSTLRRHSVSGQKDATGDVAVDTLDLASSADALQVTVTLFSADGTTTPQLRAVSAMTSLRGASAPAAAITGGDSSVWGKTLAVPQRSQMIYPDASPAWSSPTSVAMLLSYWGVDETPPTAAAKCQDVAYGGPGNAAFGAALAGAAEAGKLHGMVTRMSSFSQVEPLLAAGVPVAISLTYAAGDLPGSALASASDHRVVVKGFAPNGDVVVNDPAFATDGAVETTYARGALTAAWRKSGGATYLVWPTTTKLPTDPLGAY